MIGNSCPMYGVAGLYQNFSPATDGVPMQREESFVRLWCRDLKEEPQLSPLDVWIPYVAVKDNLQTAISRFFSWSDTPADYAGHLVYLYSSRRGAYTQGVLPELVFQFEGIHREVCGHKKWSLEQRFRDVIEGLGDLFSAFSQDEINILIQYVKDRRNNYAHANPETYHANFRLYIFVTQWMRMLDTIIVLYLCGLPIDSIKRRLSQNHEFRDVMTTLPALLKQMGGTDL